MPVLACLGLTLVFTISLSAIGGQAAPSPSVAVPVSGPVAGPSVAIIEIVGTITSGRSSGFGTTATAASGDIITLINQAALDSDVSAIVLLINSPGGGVVPSDEIYQALEEIRIPIVVQMGDLTASGGYYLSMAADHLIATPNTLTGSIGVISTFPAAEEFLEKVGVEFTVITSGEVKDFGSPYRAMDPEEREYWQSVINEVYQGFVEIVAASREMDEAEVLELADGRVFTGRQALEMGLIDEVGYLDDAIAKAAELGGIEGEPRVVRFQKYSAFSTLLGETFGGQSGLIPADSINRLLAPALEFRWVP
jgi:protease-4